ncbi:MAG TPA: SIS domain-containing protein [Gemmatimonadaceae bacterium]|nr:SIS domain-containing protein [Gemmatimonadaceae bacterium]
MTAIAQAGAVRTPAGRAAAARFAATNVVGERFFGENADAIARACHAMADRFQQGGRLFVCGDGAQRSDVAHAVVEFVHPVIVGKRALPALPLPDIRGGAALHTLATLGRPGDLLMMLCDGAPGAPALEVLATARANGILTIALVGAASGSATPADHQFAVPSPDRCIVQETQELLYHILWELVHVFFEHRAVNA